MSHTRKAVRTKREITALLRILATQQYRAMMEQIDALEVDRADLSSTVKNITALGICPVSVAITIADNELHGDLDSILMGR